MQVALERERVVERLAVEVVAVGRETAPPEAEQRPLLEHAQRGGVRVLPVPDRPVVVRAVLRLVLEPGNDREGEQDPDPHDRDGRDGEPARLADRETA